MSQTGFSQSSQAEQAYLPAERAQWRVWPWLLLLAALAIAMLIRAGAMAIVEPRGERHPAVGSRLSTFHLEPLTGDSAAVELADLTAKATLVNFWGPWCGACAVEFPHLVELVEHFRPEQNFQFLSISTSHDAQGEETLAADTEQFLKDHKADFPTYRDPEVATTIALIKEKKIEHFGYPTTMLLGPGGVIRAVWQGYNESDPTSIRQAIEKALAEKPT